MQDPAAIGWFPNASTMTAGSMTRVSKEVIAEVVSQTLGAAKGSPDMRAAGAALAKSARVVAETVRTALIPLALVNIGVRRFEEYIRTKFVDELDEATATIPEASIQEPPLNIAGPVMQGLTYTYESDELRKMFLSLLATSMDSAKDGTAHPAFADIIRQIDAEEAPYLRSVLRGVSAPLIEVRSGNETSYTVRIKHLMNVTRSGSPDTNPRIAAYVENWVRLGLVSADYTKSFTTESQYDWTQTRPEIVDAWTADPETTIQRGVLEVTPWGRDFATAVQLLEIPESVSIPACDDENDDEAPIPAATA